MTEYWISQGKKFCDFCKCWISDNKPSVTFHENGKRHQQAVENKLYDIRKRGKRDELKANREEQWMQDIESKAMRDYRSKDLGANADITAKIFNQKRAEREADKETSESDRALAAAEAAAFEAASNPMPSTSRPGLNNGATSIGPQIPDSQFQFKKVEAPTAGTKWHNEPGVKKWYEAKTDEGHKYYWHVETNESVWEAPSEGFLSIKEQNSINKQTEKKEMKRVRQILDSQALHGRKDDDDVVAHKSSRVEGPVARANPYGAWQSVESYEETTAPVDYQVPTVKEPVTANVTMYSDKFTKFEEKKTPSLGGASSSTSSSGVSKPAIVFRKRKLNDEHRKNARRRDDEDE